MAHDHPQKISLSDVASRDVDGFIAAVVDLQNRKIASVAFRHILDIAVENGKSLKQVQTYGSVAVSLVPHLYNALDRMTTELGSKEDHNLEDSQRTGLHELQLLFGGVHDFIGNLIGKKSPDANDVHQVDALNDKLDAVFPTELDGSQDNHQGDSLPTPTIRVTPSANGISHDTNPSGPLSIAVRESEAGVLDAMSVPIDLGIEVDVKAREIRVPRSSAAGIINHLYETLFCTEGDYTRAFSRRNLGNLLVRIASAFDSFPPALFLYDLKELGNEHFAGGGFADIYLGSYRDKKVALKRFRNFNPVMTKERLRKKFCKEVILWRFLKHPNVLSFLGLYEGTAAAGPHINMVSPYLNNGTVLDYTNRKCLSVAKVNRLLFQTADGLSYLHQQEIVHGDVRCANILIDDDGRACLADFGLSSLVSEASIPTATSTQGSLRWNAPELLCHAPIRTEKTDVYAFACTCLELHTRKHPFPETEQPFGVMYDIMGGKRPERPSTSDPHADQDDRLWKMCESCWSPADQRPSIDDIKWVLACLPELQNYRTILEIERAAVKQKPQDRDISDRLAATTLGVSR